MMRHKNGILFFTMAILLLMTAAAPALADTQMNPGRGASQDFIDGLAAQPNNGTGHVRVNDAWEYGKIQSGYSLVAYAGPATDAGGGAPELTPYERAALYWAEHEKGYKYSYNLNEIEDGHIVISLFDQTGGTVEYGIWAGSRIFLISVEGRNNHIEPIDTVTDYNSATDEVTVEKGDMDLEEWIKQTVGQFNIRLPDNSTATYIRIFPK